MTIKWKQLGRRNVLLKKKKTVKVRMLVWLTKKKILYPKAQGKIKKIVKSVPKNFIFWKEEFDGIRGKTTKKGNLL